MKTDEFFKHAKFEIYKVNSKTKSDLILFDVKKQIYYNDTTLIKCYDIILNENIELFYFLLLEFWEEKKSNKIKNIADEFLNPKDEKRDFLYNKGTFDLKLFKDEDKKVLKSILVLNNKLMFDIFKECVFNEQINIYNLTFIPIEKRIVEINDLKYFNIYKNNNIFSKCKARLNKDFYHIECLLKNILQEGYDYFIKFLAYKIQNLSYPIDCHFVIQDDGGTGKTKILSDILNKICNSIVISQGDLESNFNSYMVNALFVIAEEIEGYENEKKIKYLTSVGGNIRINEKGKGEYDIINYTNWIFLSNDKKSVKINEKDRRFIVIGGGKRLTPLSDGNWEKTYFKNKDENKIFFDSPKGYHANFNKELKNFYEYLLYLEVTKHELLINLPTKKKDELIKNNHGSDLLFIDDFIDLKIDGMLNEFLPNYKLENILIYIDDEKSVNFGYWLSPNIFYKLYLNYCSARHYKLIVSYNNFFKRIYDYESFKIHFEESKQISHNGKKIRVIKYKTFIDENKEIILDK